MRQAGHNRALPSEVSLGKPVIDDGSQRPHVVLPDTLQGDRHRLPHAPAFVVRGGAQERDDLLLSRAIGDGEDRPQRLGSANREEYTRVVGWRDGRGNCKPAQQHRPQGNSLVRHCHEVGKPRGKREIGARARQPRLSGQDCGQAVAVSAGYQRSETIVIQCACSRHARVTPAIALPNNCLKFPRSPRPEAKVKPTDRTRCRNAGSCRRHPESPFPRWRTCQ